MSLLAWLVGFFASFIVLIALSCIKVSSMASRAEEEWMD